MSYRFFGQRVRERGKVGPWTCAEIAHGVGCCDQTVRAACQRGKLRCHRLGRGRRYVQEADLVSWLASIGLSWEDFLAAAEKPLATAEGLCDQR